jgi:tetratricopeptide (TPR) repeat protein
LLLLDQAIERDPAFVTAYLERMRLHYLLFHGNHDSSDARLELIRSNLESAIKLAPDDPAVVWAQGLWNCMHENYDLALQQFEIAEAAGVNEPYPYHAICLFYTGRYDEAQPLFERAIALDPRNPEVLAMYGATAVFANRPMDALRAANLGIARLPDSPSGRFLHGFVLFRFAGDSREWLELAEQAVSTGVGSSLFDQDASLRHVVSLLISQQRYEDARAFLDRAPDLMRWWSEGLQHVGKTPAARFRGWLEMLAEDAPAAMSEGRRLVDFVQQQEATRWNRWYLRLLNAEGLLFSGDLVGAREAARDVVAVTSESPNLSARAAAHFMAAQVLAWAGAEEEAVTLLETLATSSPGVAPAQITRDPTLSVPLADNARYQALRVKLEAQMAALKLE